MNNKLVRTCVGCRNKKLKQELIRIVCNKQSEIMIDSKQTLSGRGAYVCKDKDCFEKAVKSHKLKNALRTNIDGRKIEEIRGVIFDGK